MVSANAYLTFILSDAVQFSANSDPWLEINGKLGLSGNSLVGDSFGYYAQCMGSAFIYNQILYSSLVPRPKQPQRRSLAVSREILQAIFAGVVWVWEQDYVYSLSPH